MREPALRGALLGLVALAIADAIAARAGLTPGLAPRLAGPAAWLASRAMGVTAYVALTLDVAFGLFVSTGRADRWIARARSQDLHRWLSGVSLALVAAHALALTLDSEVRFDVLDALVPFLAPYRPLAVGLGVLAVYAMAVVRESFAWRGRIGARAWRRLHSLSFVAFALATAHGLFAGSDTARPWMRALYLGALGIVGTLALARGRAAAAPARSASPRAASSGDGA